MELEEAFKTEASKVRAMHRTADVEVVAEQACRERVEHTPCNVPLEGGLHELKGKLNSSKRRKKVADLQYLMLLYECIQQKR